MSGIDSSVIVAAFAFAGTAVGALMSSRVIVYRIGQLERKVEKHNGMIERMYAAEGRLDAVEDRVDNIEKKPT